MDLQRVVINNFRSIKHKVFNLNESYYVLVGKNETGKTNILSALKYLDSTVPISVNNIREPLPDENISDNSYLYFVFKLNLDEINSIAVDLLSEFSHLTEEDTIGKVGNQDATLLDFIIELSEGLIKVDFVKKTRTYSYWSASEKIYTIQKKWKRIVETCPKGFAVKDKNSEEIDISKFKFFDLDSVNHISPEYYKNATINDLNELIGSKIVEILSDQEFDCIFWDYNEENLLPSKINITEFKENPNICLPLSYLFNLGGIKNIKSSLDLAMTKSPKALGNLLNRIAEKATFFFKEKWSEYDDIKFDLNINGPFIEIGVKEINKFDFAQRSDGFKRFITFLIMISAKVSTDQLRETLILIDEPEIGLHPSGQRYLRDELRKISEKNKVVFSTHSIFLVNPNDLKNHFIVTKKKELTSVKEVNSSEIVDEEVVYNALGCSVFESLKENNILFEGYSDKVLFKTATKRLPSTLSILKILKDFGLTHAKGVKDIKHITQILELANRGCLILSDSDKIAREKQSEFYKEKYYGVWYRYDELLPNGTAITAEDFIKPDVILEHLGIIKEEFNLPNLPLVSFENPKGKMYVINDWLKSLDQERRSEEIWKFKDILYRKLKPQNIEYKYYDLLKNLIKKLPAKRKAQ